MASFKAYPPPEIFTPVASHCNISQEVSGKRKKLQNSAMYHILYDYGHLSVNMKTLIKKERHMQIKPRDEMTRARQKVLELLDPGSFVEVGEHISARLTDFYQPDEVTESDGVITGYGTI